MTVYFLLLEQICEVASIGVSTAEMAATCHVSSNIVQDQLKTIFEKVGVRSRRDLVEQLFDLQCQPRSASGRG